MMMDEEVGDEWDTEDEEDGNHLTKAPLSYKARMVKHADRQEELLSDLQEQLDEADSMPVFMEESVVLRAHLNILHWAQKTKKSVPVHMMWPSRPADADVDVDPMHVVVTEEAISSKEGRELRKRGDDAGALPSFPTLKQLQAMMKQPATYVYIYLLYISIILYQFVVVMIWS